MKTYAIHDGNVITNVIVAESQEIAESITGQQAFEVLKTIGIGYRNIDGEWYPPKPFASWILDENGRWTAPIPMPPDEKAFVWNEESLSWDEVLDTRPAEI